MNHDNDNKLDFDQYKSRLLDYLSAKGVNTQISPTYCFSPTHNNTGTPALIIHPEKFACQNPSCGIHGDVYDAAGIFISSDNKRDQFEEVVRTLGGIMPEKQPQHIKKNEFIPDDAAIKRVAGFMKNHPKRKEGVDSYLETRGYTPDIAEKMAVYFGYWPGFNEALDKLGKPILKGAGIPLVHPKTRVSSWDHAGVVLRIGSGFKLFFYDDGGRSQKIGSRQCSTFPTPHKFPTSGSVILTEGEMNSISARAAGIGNIFSCGGTNGLTRDLIDRYIVGSEIDEIIICFDGDEAGRAGSQKLAGLLSKVVWHGRIKIAVMPDGKDPDDLIRAGKIKQLKNIIGKSQIWEPTEKQEPAPQPEKEVQKFDIEVPFATLSAKRLKSILNKLPRTELAPKEVEFFTGAAVKATGADTEAIQFLTEWNEGNRIPATMIEYATITAFLQFLYSRISKYLYKQTKKELIPAEEKLKTVEIARCEVVIDMDSLKSEQCVQEFLSTKGNRSAAEILAFALSNKLIYVENEDKHYAFNGHHWHREPDMGAIVYQILNNVLHAIKSEAKDPEDVWECMVKIQSRKFRQDIIKDMNGIDGIFYESVQWDGAKIAETLTLRDGVMDFSGKTIKYRKSQPFEFRRDFLPYSADDIENAGEPEFFLKFMTGNFRDEDTLTSMMYYTSLIASRYTGYKYGGIFVGPPNTGKTTTIEVLSKVYPGMIDKIPSDLLMPDARGMRKSGNEASPYIARLEGRGAAIAQESKKGAYLNGAFWKELTGGDTLTARPLYSDPKDFQPTAQIILTTNYAPHFDAHDAAVIARMIIIPFKVQHNKDSKSSMSQKEIMDGCESEAPGIIKLFASYYSVLKHEFNGEIPLSPECRAYKNQYIKGEETDLSQFIDEYCIIDLAEDAQNYTLVQDLYDKFITYVDFEDKEKPTRNKFVRWVKRDFMEIKYEQKRMGQNVLKIFRNIRLKDAQIPLTGDEPF